MKEIIRVRLASNASMFDHCPIRRQSLNRHATPKPKEGTFKEENPFYGTKSNTTRTYWRMAGFSLNSIGTSNVFKSSQSINISRSVTSNTRLQGRKNEDENTVQWIPWMRVIFGNWLSSLHTVHIRLGCLSTILDPTTPWNLTLNLSIEALN